MSDDLSTELRSLSRALDVPRAPVTDDVVAAVMARVHELPVPKPTVQADFRSRLSSAAAALRSPRRAVAAVLVAFVAALALVPPVRAQVASWFGVVVRQVDGPSSAPLGTQPPQPPQSLQPPAERPLLTLAEAARRAGFLPVVPTALGPPNAVALSDDRRLLSMTWERADGRVRLDEFDGTLSPLFVKTVYEQAEQLTVRGAFALWFARPHEVQVVDRSGAERTLPARVAGPTLVWEVGSTTLRLEGVPDQAQALAVAESALPQPNSTSLTSPAP